MVLVSVLLLAERLDSPFAFALINSARIRSPFVSLKSLLGGGKVYFYRVRFSLCLLFSKNLSWNCT